MCTMYQSSDSHSRFKPPSYAPFQVHRAINQTSTISSAVKCTTQALSISSEDQECLGMLECRYRKHGGTRHGTSRR